MKYGLMVSVMMMAFGLSSAKAADEMAAPAPAETPPTPAAAPQPVYPPELDTLSKRVSYLIGLQLANIPIDLDLATLAKAVQDGKANKPVLAPAQLREMQTSIQQEMGEKVAADAKIAGAKAKIAGAEFLAKNKTAAGVKTTASGLQYKVIKEGAGKTPTKDDTVTVHYTGKLVDGTVFDSSAGGEPASFVVGGVIGGWTEGLQLMKEGAKFELYVPAELAYKEQGSPPRIAPNSTLIFEVELISVATK